MTFQIVDLPTSRDTSDGVTMAIKPNYKNGAEQIHIGIPANFHPSFKKGAKARLLAHKDSRQLMLTLLTPSQKPCSADRAINPRGGKKLYILYPRSGILAEICPKKLPTTPCQLIDHTKDSITFQIPDSTTTH